MPRILLVLLLAFGLGLALECYNGWTYFEGQQFATGFRSCHKSYCYNLTLPSLGPTSIQKVGCSTFRCSLAGEGCHTKTIKGQEVKYCCCSGDNFCNSKYTNLSIKDKIITATMDLLDSLFKQIFY